LWYGAQLMHRDDNFTNFTLYDTIMSLTECLLIITISSYHFFTSSVMLNIPQIMDNVQHICA